MHLAKTQLHCGVTFALRTPDLGNIARPSFDKGNGISDTALIEDLGHSDLLANQPFQHPRFSPFTKIFLRLSARALAASSRNGAVKRSVAAHGFHQAYEQYRSCFVVLSPNSQTTWTNLQGLNLN